MAIAQIRSTYALDVETVGLLEKMADRLGISKSEALRRAIRAAASKEGIRRKSESLQALEQLQASLDLDQTKANRWLKEIRAERRSQRIH